MIRADVVVIGAHAAGVGATVSAALNCLTVVLVSAETVPGGMLTAGQIGASDATPTYTWPELGGSGNGTVSNWALLGGVWRRFRTVLSTVQRNPQPSMVNTMRYLPADGARAVMEMLNKPNILLLRASEPISVAVHDRLIRSALVSTPAGIVRVEGHYWVDGSDTGTFVSLLGLPFRLGYEDAGHPYGTGEVMAYTYRWTAVESNTGLFPNAPPPYYASALREFRSLTARYWPTYKAAFNIADGSAYAVHPFRLFTALGRLSGSVNAEFALPGTGLPSPNEPTEVWDVNTAPTEVANFDIGAYLSQDQQVAAMFAHLGLSNPYAFDGLTRYQWSDIAFVQDQKQLPASARATLVDRIHAIVKDRSLDFLWFIRGGDMLATLRTLPGGQNLELRSGWSILNGLNTADGMPELMYEREGRRIVSRREETALDLCPSLGADIAAGRLVCTDPPLLQPDAILLADGPFDSHATSHYPGIPLQPDGPYQLSYAALLSTDIDNLAVGGAVGVDRTSFTAFRLDPVRLMTGGAIGDAVALALRHNVELPDVSILQLRDILAAQGQATAPGASFPRWDETLHKWLGDDQALRFQMEAASAELRDCRLHIAMGSSTCPELR